MKVKDGKRGSRFNSTSHGIFATILLSGESFGEARERYLGLLSDLREGIRPAGPLEQVLVEKLAAQYFRLARLYEADARIAPKIFIKLSEVLEEGHPTSEALWIQKGEVVVARKDPSADLLVRYESGLERQIDRTLNQLNQLRQMRANAPAHPKAKAEETHETGE